MYTVTDALRHAYNPIIAYFIQASIHRQTGHHTHTHTGTLRYTQMHCQYCLTLPAASPSKHKQHEYKQTGAVRNDYFNSWLICQLFSQLTVLSVKYQQQEKFHFVRAVVWPPYIWIYVSMHMWKSKAGNCCVYNAADLFSWIYRQIL